MLRCCNEQLAGLEQQLAARFGRPSGRDDSAELARAWGGAGRAAAGRVRRRPAPVCHCQRPHGVHWHRAGHQILRTAHGGCPGGLHQRLLDACYLWAFAALSASPGARPCYDAHPARGATHHQALRTLGNRLVGILHGCLARRVAYQEQVA
jgi:hypothetical protein